MIFGGWFAEREAETEIWNIESKNGTLVDQTLRDSDYYNLAIFEVDKNFCPKSAL